MLTRDCRVLWAGWLDGGLECWREEHTVARALTTTTTTPPAHTREGRRSAPVGSVGAQEASAEAKAESLGGVSFYAFYNTSAIRFVVGWWLVCRPR